MYQCRCLSANDESKLSVITTRPRLRKKFAVEDEGQIQRVCEDAEARGSAFGLDGRRLFPFVAKVNDSINAVNPKLKCHLLAQNSI